jgi:hypothetical protein
MHGHLDQLHDGISQIADPQELLGVIDGQYDQQRPLEQYPQVLRGDLCHIEGVGSDRRPKTISLDFALQSVDLKETDGCGVVDGSAVADMLVLDPLAVDNVEDKTSDGQEVG